MPARPLHSEEPERDDDSHTVHPYSRAGSIFEIVQAGHWELLPAAMESQDINAQDENGMTVLHHAAARGARPCIRILVGSGQCNYLLRDKNGRYASELAILSARDFAVARLLGIHQARQATERNVPTYEHPRLKDA